MNKEITLEQLASYETAFDSDRANRIAMDAATKNGVNNAAMRFENAREMRHTFNISLEQGDITNQKQSGPLLDVRGAQHHALPHHQKARRQNV